MLSIRAHAKINLDLRILGVRPDGYHEVRTILQAIDLHDTVNCARHDGPLTLDCSDPTVPADARNLAWQAAAAVWAALERTGPVHGVHIRLDKAIPAQAGLGGGSADAAAVVVALQRLWEVQLAPDVERRVLARLGADVPFMACGGTAVGEGRGDSLRGLPPPPVHWVVLAKPDVGVSTADAYRWFDDDSSGPAAVPPPVPSTPAEWGAFLGQAQNDLEAPVVARHPSIGALVAALRRQGARLAAMSGSGAAVFGLFDDEGRAQAARDVVQGLGVWTCLTRTRPRGLLDPALTQ